jgi:NAD-dependent DNA ligase
VLNTIKREEAKEKIILLGGITSNSVNRKLSFLITNDKDTNSQKSIKAKEYKIPIINESEFYDILENPSRVNYYLKHRYL